MDGWEDAYNAFAEAFQRHGAQLSSRQTRLDLLNMLFNFALKSGWIPHLVLAGDTPELSDIISPKRVHGPAYCAKPDHRGVVVVGTKQSVDWFHARIQPAVTEWNAKALERQMKYDAFRNQMSEMPLKDLPAPDADQAIAKPSPMLSQQPSSDEIDESSKLAAKEDRISSDGSRLHWLQKELNLRGWSTLTLYDHRGPDRKTTEGYIKGKKITANTLKKIVDALNSEIPPGCSKIDINNLPH